MATLSSSTSSIHRDNRSDSRSYKRDKEHSTKWALGARPRAGVKQSFVDDTLTATSEEQQVKVRPMKKQSEADHRTKHSGNGFSKYKWDFAAGRIARKQHNLLEISSEGPSLSKSLSELLPTSPVQSRTSSTDAGVLYSFDAPTTPRKVVGLDSLVEKAEIEFQSRETDKIVRDEYEILDESGEIKVMTKGKGKKGSPRYRAPAIVTTKDDEDDWEQI